ncbi:MAG TPA: methyltransferase domain-containing protein [Pseudonocardiaceae bacterium]|nr:methyltransferase domain-containing protein [Pseudonocardiaceae bacterium]
MEFVGELAVVQQRLAACRDLVARRLAVLETLAVAPGEQVLEAGCGSGLLLREIGAAVGEQGLAIGIDVSPDQLTAARSHCKDMTQVQVRVEDMRAVAAADELFDATVYVQVLEYVPDVETAVAEAARVTKPGGRFVNVATNWGSLWWAGGETELTARMVSVWHGHAPHPNLPVVLPLLLEHAGFTAVHQRPLTILNRHFHADTFSYWAARLIAAYATANGGISPDDAIPMDGQPHCRQRASMLLLLLSAGTHHRHPDRAPDLSDHKIISSFTARRLGQAVEVSMVGCGLTDHSRPGQLFLCRGFV